MYNILKSAWSGYLNYGFDIGGYRGQNISKAIFLRWVQTGALLPFMENGGNGKHRPWVFDEETVAIYRKFVNIHYQLRPHFLTTGATKYKLKQSALTPLASKIPQDSSRLPDSYGYLLGDDILVFPIFQENGQAEIKFPTQSNWVYFFNTAKVFPGGLKNFLSFELA